MSRKRALCAGDAKGTQDLRKLFAENARLAHERRVMQVVLEAPSPLAADDRLEDACGPTALRDLQQLNLNDEGPGESDEGEAEPDTQAPSGTNVSGGAGPSTETIDERRARTLREWDALKDEIMGTPATWGICPYRKRPRKRQPNRSTAERQATRNEYVAHRHEMKSEHKHDHKTRFVTSSYTSWHPGGAYFDTNLQGMPCLPNTVHILSHTWADACRADAAAVACSDAHGKSLRAQRAKKKERLAENAARREFGLSIGGDNSALERRELLRLRDHVHRVTNRSVRVLICPDGCWADALFRTEAMSEGQWLTWQHKSTARMATNMDGTTYWCFGKVLGYTGPLVVCSVEAESDRLWVLRGKVLDDNGSQAMQVTKSKKNGILPVPADGKTLPTNLYGLVHALQRECAKVVDGDTDALRTFTVEEADAMLGQAQAVERAGVLAWMRCAHGGDQVPWLEMSEMMRADDRNLRLLRDGTVVAYPEGQNTKVDLEVLHDWENPNGHKTTYQFKTASKLTGQSGFRVDLQTKAGRNGAGTQMSSNTYKVTDNDFYVAVLPDRMSVHARKGHVDIWEFPEAALFERGLLGTADTPPAADTDGFYVYRKCCTANAHTHKWTRDYHACYAKTHHGWLPGSDVGEALEQDGLLFADSDTEE